MADMHLLAAHAQVFLQGYARDNSDVHLRETLGLSERELEIMRWTLEGKSSWAIAVILALSTSTVNFHVRNATLKLDAINKHQAAAKARSLKLI